MRRSDRSPTCARARSCAKAPRRERSSRSRTPTSAGAARSRTCPTSVTPTSARVRISARRRSRRTTTASRSTARRSATACVRGSIRRSLPPSRSATTPSPARTRRSRRRCRPAHSGSRASGRSTTRATRTASAGTSPKLIRDDHGPAAAGAIDSPRARLRQEPDAVLGSCEPRSRREDRRQARRDTWAGDAQDVHERRGLLPLRRVDSRRRRVHRPADVRATRRAA